MGKRYLTYFAYFVLSAIIFIAGLYSGKVAPDAKSKGGAPVVQSLAASELPLLNPILTCRTQEGDVNMHELKNFRYLIENYVSECKRKHPDIFIAYYFRDLNNGIWIGVN